MPSLKNVSADEWAYRKLYVAEGEVFFDESERDTGGATITATEKSSPSTWTHWRGTCVNSSGAGERAPDQIGRVIRDRWTMSGVPIIAGTRIPTATIYDYPSAWGSPRQDHRGLSAFDRRGRYRGRVVRNRQRHHQASSAPSREHLHCCFTPTSTSIIEKRRNSSVPGHVVVRVRIGAKDPAVLTTADRKRAILLTADKWTEC